MKITLATYMKLALTVVMISVLIFYVAYSMLDKESDKYKEHIEKNITSILSES